MSSAKWRPFCLGLNVLRKSRYGLNDTLLAYEWNTVVPHDAVHCVQLHNCWGLLDKFNQCLRLGFSSTWFLVCKQSVNQRTADIDITRRQRYIQLYDCVVNEIERIRLRTVRCPQVYCTGTACGTIFDVVWTACGSHADAIQNLARAHTNWTDPLVRPKSAKSRVGAVRDCTIPRVQNGT